MASDALKDARMRSKTLFEGYENNSHLSNANRRWYQIKALKFGKKLRCYILKKTFEKDHSNKYYKETYNTVVLKRLRNSLDTELLKIGLSDLLVEASILAQCSHPNIISIHAIGGDDTTYYDNQSNQLYND